MPRRRRVNDEDEDLDDGDDDDDDEEVARSKKKKSKKSSFLDDSAVDEDDEEGGGDDDDEEEEEDDENGNEYVKDGFLVDDEEDEEEIVRKKKKKRSDDLEDSDDDDSDDSTAQRKKRKEMRKKSRLKKLKESETLADDDLDLIREAQGLGPREEVLLEEDINDRNNIEHIRARNSAELQKGLFHDGDDDATGGGSRQQKSKGRGRHHAGGDFYDEDGMDEFIEDDLGVQDDIRREDRGMMDDYDGEGMGGPSDEQINAATEIFGTDYLDFMNQDGGGAGGGRRGRYDEDDEEDELMGRNKYRERGVGVDYDVDGGDDDEEGSLFDDGDEDEEEDEAGMDGMTAQQKAEALKLKREKKRLAREERRAKAQAAKNEKRKAQLRRAFEPVQLIEHFCTDRDDQIRQTDVPERFFDWVQQAKFYGTDVDPAETNGTHMSEEERQEAEWIASRIPDISYEYTSLNLEATSSLSEEQPSDQVLQSIAFALRYMHRNKLEPAMIKRYRKDYVTSKSVREHLAQVMEEDGEWDRMIKGREKVQALLKTITAQADGDAQSGADADRIVELRQQVEQAKQALDDSQARASTLLAELEALNKKGKGGDDEDDDQLFEDDDEEDDEEREKERARERQRVASSLKDVQELVTLRQDRAKQLSSQLELAEAQERALKDREPMERVMKKAARRSLWNAVDYERVLELSSSQEPKHVVDMHGYLNLIQEGNDAIKKKELPILAAGDGKDAKQRRSRRFDRDFYRTCVAEGLRAVCYKYLLPPNRVGIKLEDSITSGGSAFNYSKAMPGEEGHIDPLQWVPPQIPQSPAEFANELIGSGELVLLSASGGAADNADDPLRGCRYVAALELASEPRVRKHLRKVYRKNALLSTKPTKKGVEELDAFHDFYGLHLIHNKPASDHFPLDSLDQAVRKSHMTPAERVELDDKMRKRQVDSCLQFLNISKAAKEGFLTTHIHLPVTDANNPRWYRPDDTELTDRTKQDIDILASELEKVYLPIDGDTEEWNDERRKVVSFSLLHFLLPLFETELRRDILGVSSKVGVEAAAGKLREMAMVGPFRPDKAEPPGLYYNESRFIVPTDHLEVVGLCCSSDGREASYLAYVSEHGKAEDFLAIPSGTRIDHGKMREKVLVFLIKNRPDVVVVGTSGGFESRAIYRRMKDLIAEAKNRWDNRHYQGDDEDDDAFRERQDNLEALSGKHDFNDDMEWKCDIELIDDNVASLYGRSVRSKKEFPDFPTNHKIAIATARYAKDPLAELAYTWNVASDAGVFGAEILYLDIHPAQRLLPRTMLLREYERTLCDVTAEVGCDINLAIGHDHLRGLLTFVPGLGPRKAANIKQLVSDAAEGVVARRRDLLDTRLMGPIVYDNAAAFLRIQQIDQLSDQPLNPLDNTRLHPAVYLQHDWAARVAIDALDRENKKEKANKAISDAMANSRQEVVRLFEATRAEWEQKYDAAFQYKGWDPRVNVPVDHWSDEVCGLDLDAFADAIAKKGRGRWHSHFEMLLWEFRLPFLDPREPMKPLSIEALFELITNENDKSLRPGKEVTGKVVSNGEFGSRVKLEGDIPAFIPLRNLSDDHVEAPEDVVHPGQIVTAVVTEVKKDHMTVDLSLKMEDFRKSPSSWPRPESLPPFDDFFDRSAASRIEEDNNKKREAHLEALQIALKKPGEGGVVRKKRVVLRACTHPAFRNAKNDAVDKELREGGEAMVGQALIRPSNKQSDSLAIHWVVRKGVIKVIEVTEEDKETDTAIGNILKIKDETYGSIDELLGRYVEPMNDLVEEVTSHRKFKNITEDDLDEVLKKEKQKNPGGIPYYFCWMDMYPGYISLRFIQNISVKSHIIAIAPNGYVLRGVTYQTLDLLINAFKKNPLGSAAPKKPTASTNEPIVLPPKPPAPTIPSPPKPPATSRWGAAKPLAPPAAPPAWQQERPAPPPRPIQASGWNAGPPPPPRPPPRPPPVHPGGFPPGPTGTGYAPAPVPSIPPPPRPPPPPPMHRGFGQQPPPPRPPGPPPAFTAEAPPQPTGRGRGRTIPAWLAKQQNAGQT